MSTDHKSIKCTVVKFAKHPKAKCKNAHPELTQTLGLTMHDVHHLFTVDSRIELKPSCASIINKQITKKMKECVAKEGQDPTKAPEQSKGSSHSCQDSDSGQAVQQNGNVMHALNLATENKLPCINI